MLSFFEISRMKIIPSTGQKSDLKFFFICASLKRRSPDGHGGRTSNLCCAPICPSGKLALASWWRPPILPSGLGRFREAQITPRFARQVDFIANMLCSKHLSNWGFDILKPFFFYLDTKNCFNNSCLASLG